MNGSLIQILVFGIIVAVPILLIASGRRKAETQRRIADALEEIARKKKDDE
jgi:hypothetical protein